ncbi:hypothetical protein HHK36_001946 [Tetracentron sinense]|uniref:Uncharacterized protein n=1 Tax=Tetracentron sinense TaxID=13715 RepID=A0A834ZUJ9_TETSI|nr:hypothetical protein HHK36_001946 [Tetracentron sinense]
MISACLLGFEVRQFDSNHTRYEAIVRGATFTQKGFLAHPGCLEMEVLPHHNLLFISAALLFRGGNLMGFARNVGLDIKDFLLVPAKGILQVHIIHNIKV